MLLAELDGFQNIEISNLESKKNQYMGKFIKYYLGYNNKDGFISLIFKDLGLEKYIECLDVKSYLYDEILKIKEPDLPFD